MEKFFISKVHNSTKRNYVERMINNKIQCMKVAKKYSYDYWDGNRMYGYGGYKFIPGRWTPIAKKIIKDYKLTNRSSILDLGCGKGYLLFEIKKILPKINILGYDYSKYAIINSKKEIKKYLKVKDIRNKFSFKNNQFDLVLSLGTLHNFELSDLYKTIKEINRIAKRKYIMVESFRNDTEQFNLQCWALTCQTFLSKKEWINLYKFLDYKGDFEFIYFK
ncbi:class I SAM-dependent methyltransferase [Candidatus Pelagibacter sp. Uisw_106]|uniref:class I SAM-dependent methyltransferase n=1 Tax=Candidatus Pelagibacter sp. Uisw_106 TaxID=3230984 RepID=UPI0039ED9AA1